MEYKSCRYIENFFLMINGRIDTKRNVIALCCEAIGNVPAVSLADKAMDTLMNFVGMRELLLIENSENGG